ncbi:MAG: hypothetical protein U0Q07_04275 [Acidimicrobiales bacterium]
MTTIERPSPGGLPPLGLVPGVHYRGWGPYDMLPNDWVSGRSLNFGAYVPLGGGELRIDLDLEAGITITEVAFSAINGTASTVIGRVDRFPYSGGTATEVGSVSFPANNPSVDVRGSAVANVVVAEGDAYTARMSCDGSSQWLGFRLGYIPFGFGYSPIAPKRVYDSRAGNPPLGVTKGPLSNGTRVINMLNGVTLPAGVKPVGLLVNLAVVNTSASGFLSLYQNGQPDPGTSSINWFRTNEIVANTTFTGIDASGNAIAKVPANASTDFFIDVVGYYA